MPLENLNPMPNLKVNNEFKIDSSKNRIKILKDEVEKKYLKEGMTELWQLLRQFAENKTTR